MKFANRSSILFTILTFLVYLLVFQTVHATPSFNPFEFVWSDGMHVVKISSSMDEAWPGGNHLQKFYVDLHKHAERWPDTVTVDDVDFVLVSYFGGVLPYGKTERMWDDGNHLDGKAGDCIYGYHDLLDASNINTTDYSFRIMPFTGASITSLPFKGTPPIPEPFYPVNGITIAELKPTFRWKLVPGVESYGVAVFDSVPAPETIYKSMVWMKDSHGDTATQISMETDSVELEPGKTYYWILWCYDEGGYIEGEWKATTYSMEWASFTTVVGRVSSSTVVPRTFNLGQNYPNPFNLQTRITYNLLTSGKAILRIYNLLGKPVRTLINEDQSEGTHSIVWDGRDDNGQNATSGVYLYRLEVKGFFVAKKMVIFK